MNKHGIHALLLTDAVRVGSVDHLMDVGLHNLEASDGTGLRQTTGRVAVDDLSNGIGVVFIPSAVDRAFIGSAVCFVLRSMIVLRNHDRRVLQAIDECAT